MKGKIIKIVEGTISKTSENIYIDSEDIIHNSGAFANYNSEKENIFGDYKEPCDCTEIEKNKLQKEVENQCKGGVMKKCTDNDNCPLLIVKINQFRKCLDARVRINTKCFRGGDKGHAMQVQQVINGITNCQIIQVKKCSPKENVPTPTKTPVYDEGFIKEMERITGLTGAALIIYLIISEGSRILFPPRNFVPVP